MSLRGMANVVSQYYFDAPTAQIIEPKRSALIFGYVGKWGLTPKAAEAFVPIFKLSENAWLFP